MSMRHLIIDICAGLAALLSVAVQADGVETPAPYKLLSGQWQQGSLLRAKTDPAAQVWFNGRKLTLDAQGEFVFGLDRDAPADAELKIQLPDATTPQVLHYQVSNRDYKIQRINGLPPKMVTPPAALTARIENDQREAREARDHVSDLDGFAQQFIWPAEGRISGVFGSQRILNGEPRQPHYGVDVAVPIGTAVRAPADGVVTLAAKDMYYTGGTLMIDHGHGVASTFLHLSKLRVKLGDVVKQGQIIAESGMSGRATGPHLDWRVSWFQSRVDAEQLVPPMPKSAIKKHK